jgi:hypothetical protein
MIKVKLTEKEKKLILEFIKIQLDSYKYYQTPKKKEFDFDCDFSEDMFDKDLMKSIYDKLNIKSGGTNRKK